MSYHNFRCSYGVACSQRNIRISILSATTGKLGVACGNDRLTFSCNSVGVSRPGGGFRLAGPTVTIFSVMGRIRGLSGSSLRGLGDNRRIYNGATLNRFVTIFNASCSLRDVRFTGQSFVVRFG